MQIYGPSHAHGPQGISGPHQRHPASKTNSTQSAPRASDQLDISAAAQAAADGADAGISRTERVAQIRQSIADGSYESTGKLASAIERLLDDIG